MISRLEGEHRNFELNLKKIRKHISKDELKDAIEIIYNMRELIIKHAVEEEARIMRVIMQKAKEESVDSIKIMQEHNWVVDFLKHDFEKIYNSVHKQDQQQLQQIAKNEINKFVINLRNHFLEEERIVFPLALRASAANSS